MSFNKKFFTTGGIVASTPPSGGAGLDPLQNFETVTYTGNGSTQKITGYIRKGAAFNGSSSYINIPNPNNLFLSKTTSSVSFWFKLLNNTAKVQLFSDYAVESWSYAVSIDASGFLRIGARYNSGTQSSASSTATYDDGNWHHIAITNDIGTLTQNAYIDGNSTPVATISLPSASWSSSYQSSAKINIGHQYFPNTGTRSEYLNGSIDQVRIFNTALNSTQVGQLALETYADPKKSTTDYFGDGSGVSLYELDDDANDTGGTYNGTPTNVNFLGMAFQPDLVWIKNRNDSFFWHNIWDSVRGVNKGLFPNVTAIEDNQSPRGYLSSFDTNGFTVTSGTTDAGNNNGIGKNIVAWCWKAADTTTTIAANTIGNTIASDVRANTDAGFSIVKYTGNGTSGSTIGHGLSSSPEFIIVKNLSELFNWMTFAEPIGADFFCEFNESNQFQNTTDEIWKDTLPTSTIFTVGNNATVNKLNNNYIAYCFHSVDGYQKVGSYSGGSSGSSNVIATGFKPRFLLVKRTDASGDAWQMFDSIRGGGDTFDNYLQANEAYAETSYSLREVNFADNGFYWTNAESGTNISGGTYIYLAIA